MANTAPTTPSTPSRLPPISHPPLSTPGRPPSPLNASEVANFSMQAVPVGCELIIRGITPEDGKTASEIVLLDDNNELYDISVIPGSSGRFSNNTFCYVRLSMPVASEQTEPRPDLLNPWIPVLSSLHPNWQASWSPCKMEKDKKLWCRISGMSGNGGKTNWDKDLAVITDVIRKLGVNVSSSWSTANGQMGVVVLSQVGEVLFLTSKSPLSVTLPNQDPSVSGHRHPSHIDITAPYKQINPVYAFEVVITGIGDYNHSFALHLDRYFTTLTEPDGTSFFRSSRIPETDVYCVVLSSWEATKTVLSNTKFFDQHVRSSALNVAYPRLLWDVNMTGAFAQRAVAAINKAGEMLEARLNLFESKINEICRETSSNLNAVEQRIGAMENGIQQITGAVTQMGLALQDTQMALMAQHRRSQIADHRSSLYHQHESLIRKLDRAQNSQEEDTIDTELDVISQKIEEADEQLSEFDRTITGIAAGPPQHPQQAVTPTPLTPARSNRQPIPSMPESPLAAKRRLHNKAGPHKQISSARAVRSTANVMDEDDIVDENAVQNSIAGSVLNGNAGQGPPAATICAGLLSESGLLSNGSDPVGLNVWTNHCSLSSWVPSPFAHILLTLGFSECIKYFLTCCMIRDLRSLIHSFFVSFLSCILSSVCRALYSGLITTISFLESVPYLPKQLILLLLVSSSVTASGFGPNCATASFSIYALNANGMHHALKLIHINNAIGHRNPSVFVISELKSTMSTANRITLKNYNIFEEHSQPTAGTWKWGVMLGI
ncbi:hypothetical protein IW261DRAFT_1576680 [Armillaria novae-zelandiae]|uniref:Uncharacterized protein n=1 Tax=Armillaria novae-zelandiae TaxID=153914 RepID=A0AA39N9M0_9AGAR|nr:hypothetical protein IW261DRAFT_1576680 [Armillaria novae-zelandiae]